MFIGEREYRLLAHRVANQVIPSSLASDQTERGFYWTPRQHNNNLFSFTFSQPLTPPLPEHIGSDGPIRHLSVLEFYGHTSIGRRWLARGVNGEKPRCRSGLLPGRPGATGTNRCSTVLGPLSFPSLSWPDLSYCVEDHPPKTMHPPMLLVWSWPGPSGCINWQRHAPTHQASEWVTL